MKIIDELALKQLITEIKGADTLKVDKVIGKSLIEDTKISKLDGIKEGANKTEASTINGNLIIDGIETKVISINKSDIELGNVNNTSDLEKPISTPTQNALNLKINTDDLQAITSTEVTSWFTTL